MSNRREKKKDRSSSRRQQGSQGSSIRKRFSFSSSRRGGGSRRNKRGNQSGKDGGSGSIMSSSSTSSASRSGTAKAKTIPIEGIVWKRRSGLGQLSETVGVGRSWERRRLVLLAGDGVSRSSKLCYYALQEGDGSQRGQQLNNDPPRGVIDLILERAVICATHLNDSTQPTPYSISIKTKPDGLSSSTEATTKWKFCFDDRKSQMAWLVALTDAVVDASVKEYNAHTLCVAADFHGGWKLYLEDEAGIFDSVKDVLLQQEQQDAPTTTSGNSSDNKNLAQSISTTTTKDSTSLQSTPSQSPTSSLPPEDKLKNEQNLPPPPPLAKEVNDLGYILSETRFYHALAIFNLSIIYAHMSGSLSIPLLFILPWWQTLLVANICLYCICFVSPPATTPLSSEKKKKEEEEVCRRSPPNATNSTIGAELLREKEVPLSEDPEEEETKTTVKRKEKEEQPDHREEPLSEEEMAAHRHERWAMSAPNVDLSGSWTLVADDAFKTEYDAYLKDLGFNRITRGVACSLISRTAEETKQTDGGRKLYLKGSNPKGVWERTLIASGYPDFDTNPMKQEGMDYNHLKRSIKTADSEDVEAEAWWEKRGTVHRSMLRGSAKYGGGDHESLRYLEDDGKILVCESIFHGRNKKATVRWRFQREEE